MTQIKPAVWASSAMVDRAGCGAEGFLYLEGPDVDAEIPLYDQTTVDALRKGAERYAFLRDVGPPDSETGYPKILQWTLVTQNRYTGELLFGEDLDRAIDAAMNGANTYSPNR